MRYSPVKQFRLLWNNIEAIIIFFFFATFPFNIRKVIITPFSYINGQFNEFATITIHLSDLIVLSVIIIYIIKWLISQYLFQESHLSSQKHIIVTLSNYYRILSGSNVSRETLLLLIFLFWSAISAFWSSYIPIAVYRIYIMLSLVTFFSIIIYNVKIGHLKRNFIYIAVVGSGAIQSVIAVSQFIANHSIGLKFLGESELSPNLPGVAKIFIENQKHIRSYGTFPHPNILAAFLVIQIVLLIYFYFRPRVLEFHKNIEGYVSREIQFSKRQMFLGLILFFITLLAFAFTFSRSAYISFFLASTAFIYLNMKIFKPYLKYVLTGVLFSVIILSSGILISRSLQKTFLSVQSLEERNTYFNVSCEIISSHPFIGIGIGQFVYNEHLINSYLEGWIYQPVHNIYLLIASELGLVGLALFILIILFYLVKYFADKNGNILTLLWLCVILCFLLISFFDHYFWDLEQGMIIFLLPFLFLNFDNKLISQKR